MRGQERAVASEFSSSDQPVLQEGDQSTYPQLAYPTEKRERIDGFSKDVQSDTARLADILRSLLSFGASATLAELQSVSCPMGAAEIQTIGTAQTTSEKIP